MVDVAWQRAKWVFLLKVFVGVLLCCFQSVFLFRESFIKFCGYPLSLRCFWNSSSPFWKFSFAEFVLSSRRASPFIKPFLTPNGWQDEKCVYWNVSVGLKCVPTSRINMLLKLSPLYTIVSRNVTLSSEISAVNLIVAWWLFACSMKCVISSLPVSQREKMLPIYLFQQIGFFALLFNSSVCTFVMKMFAKATATVIPIAVLCISRQFFPLNWNEFSFKMSLSACSSDCVGIGGLPL